MEAKRHWSEDLDLYITKNGPDVTWKIVRIEVEPYNILHIMIGTKDGVMRWAHKCYDLESGKKHVDNAIIEYNEKFKNG